MFGIGLPEFILIMALALIVVGPDKLPDLARSVAKGILDLKKTANTLKESLIEDGNPLDEIQPELEKAAKALTNDLLNEDDDTWKTKDLDKIYKQKNLHNDDATTMNKESRQPTERSKSQGQPKNTAQEENNSEVDDSKTEEINKQKARSEQQS